MCCERGRHVFLNWGMEGFTGYLEVCMTIQAILECVHTSSALRILWSFIGRLFLLVIIQMMNMKNASQAVDNIYKASPFTYQFLSLSHVTYKALSSHSPN